MHRQLATAENVGIINLEQLSAQQSEALGHFIHAQKLSAGTRLPAQNYAFNVKSNDRKVIVYRFTLDSEVIYLGEIDPSSTDPIHTKTLQSLFEQVTPTRALPAGIQCIQQDGKLCLYQLKYGIYPRTPEPGYYIVNDATESVLGKGISGNVCDVIGKWQPTIESPQQLSYTPSHDKRVMKIFHHLKSGAQFNVANEHNLMQCLPYFKVREIMRHEVGGTSTKYISQKKIKGINFTEILRYASTLAPFTTTQKLSIAILLVRALWRDMHLHGILHRDVKPPNIIADSDESLEYWRVKLVDLGCARNISETKLSFAGTPIYNAPEVCANQEYSTKSDLYSASRVIGELFGDGEIEFYRINPQPNFEKTRANQELIRFKLSVTRTHDLSPAQDAKLVKILERMACGKPSERYEVEEAIAALEAFRLEVIISRAHESMSDSLKVTHETAVTLAKMLDIKSVEHCKQARPIIELQTDILQAIEKIGDSEQELSLFKTIVAMKCLVTCINKEDVHNNVTTIIANFEKNCTELALAVRNLEGVYTRLKKQDVPEQAMKIERDLKKAKLKLSTHAKYQFDLDDIDEANLSLRQSITKVNALTRYCEASPALESTPCPSQNKLIL